MGWMLPWLLIAIFVGVAVWLLVSTLGGDDTTPIARETTSPSPTPTPEPSETLVLASPTAEASPSPKPKPSEAKPKKLIVEGITVQVLNSTSDTEADDAISERLTGLGFQIENMERASRPYQRTTVFWSYDEAREAAERLAERFGWVAEPKPDNLSDTVALHIIVGEDEL